MKSGLIKRTILSLFMPTLYVNLLGLAAGAMWLAALSQWQFVGLGVVLVFFSPHIIPVLLLPAGIFSRFMLLYQNAGRRKKAQAMFILSLAYILLFMTLWCVGIFGYAMGSAGPEGTQGAMLLWASTAAMLPLFLWSSHDRGNIFIVTMVEMAQVAVLILCAVRLSGVILSFWPSFAVFGGLLALVMVTQAVYEEKFMKKSAAAPR
jgi:hypothetical protein